MEYIDIFDENNNPTGQIKEKEKAHEGSRRTYKATLRKTRDRRKPRNGFSHCGVSEKC